MWSFYIGEGWGSYKIVRVVRRVVSKVKDGINWATRHEHMQFVSIQQFPLVYDGSQTLYMIMCDAIDRSYVINCKHHLQESKTIINSGWNSR